MENNGLMMNAVEHSRKGTKLEGTGYKIKMTRMSMIPKHAIRQEMSSDTNISPVLEIISQQPYYIHVTNIKTR